MNKHLKVLFGGYLPTWGKSLSNKKIEINSHIENKSNVSIKDTCQTVP